MWKDLRDNRVITILAKIWSLHGLRIFTWKLSLKKSVIGFLFWTRLFCGLTIYTVRGHFGIKARFKWLSAETARVKLKHTHLSHPPHTHTLHTHPNTHTPHPYKRAQTHTHTHTPTRHKPTQKNVITVNFPLFLA